MTRLYWARAGPPALSFTAVLTTRGRVTGRPHSKTLRAVRLGGILYFTRRRPDSDWFLNALADARVSVSLDGRTVRGSAFRVEDAGLLAEISRAKYPGQARAAEPRVGIGVRLCAQGS